MGSACERGAATEKGSPREGPAMFLWAPFTVGNFVGRIFLFGSLLVASGC